MGDKYKEKTPYKPHTEPVRCDVSGRVFSSSLVRKCRDSAVISQYGVGGEANVSIWICRKCKHAIAYKLHGGLGCELEQQVQT